MDILWIILAFVVGLILGWLARQLMGQDQAPAAASQGLQEALSRREQELAAAQARIRELEARLAAVKVEPDDLTRINGIGPVYRRLLHEAGIDSFAKLADTNIEQIKDILNLSEWRLVEPEGWIRQARELAG